MNQDWIDAIMRGRGIRETERCPNCGTVVYRGECRHTSNTKAGVLYGVCKPCADRHTQAYKFLDEVQP